MNKKIYQIDYLQENQIKEFAYEFFKHFDILDEVEYFLQYISDDARFIFPQGEFIGREGFVRWYDDIKQKIKPNNKHIVNSINVKADKDDNSFVVDLNITLDADTYDGKKLHLTVNERWQVILTLDDKILINEYVVL